MNNTEARQTDLALASIEADLIAAELHAEFFDANFPGWEDASRDPEFRRFIPEQDVLGGEDA